MKVFVADKISDAGIEHLQQTPGIEVDFSTGLSPEKVCEHIADADGLIVRSATTVTPEVIMAAKQLKVIGRAGIGVDNIDIPHATEQGIVVLNTPDANATTTAELAIAHIFSLSRHLPAANSSIRAGEWKRSRFMGAEITGKTVGVIGYGTIGRIVSSRCLGLQMRVVAYDPFVTKEKFQEDGVEPMELEKLLAHSDYVTLHCPMMDATRNLLNADRLALMKPGARLVNCARGGLVDETALFDALTSGHLAGAALDVFRQEPPKDSPLLELDNIVFTPHLGASTDEAQVAVGVAIAQQVGTFLTTGEAINALNLPRISGEELYRLRPFQHLARQLGKLLSALSPTALNSIEVAVNGRAAELDTHAIAVEALVGVLGNQLSVPVNSVNACHLAQRQGINLVESRSEDAQDYVSLLTITGTFEDNNIRIAGTLLGERHPRLVGIDDFEIEAIPEGFLLITRHQDRPGVIGALGDILGKGNINITNMHVGSGTDNQQAMAVIDISSGLSDELLSKICSIDAVTTVFQVSL